LKGRGKKQIRSKNRSGKRISEFTLKILADLSSRRGEKQAINGGRAKDKRGERSVPVAHVQENGTRSEWQRISGSASLRSSSTGITGGVRRAQVPKVKRIKGIIQELQTKESGGGGHQLPPKLTFHVEELGTREGMPHYRKTLKRKARKNL